MTTARATPPEFQPGEAPIGFVGRRAELGRLSEWWHEAQQQSGPTLALVVGESGVGKTRLVEEFVASLAGPAGDVPVVLWGTSYGTSFLAYEPWVVAMRALLSRPDRQLVEAAIGSQRAAVLGVPWLADLARGDDDSVAEVGSPTEEVVAAVVDGLLERVATEFPVLVVLDDVQWADRGSIELLRRLLASPSAEARGNGYLVLAVERRPSARSGSWHEAVDSEALAPTWELDLDRLDQEACGSLLEEIAPHAASAELAAALYAASNGNAFMARELAIFMAQSWGRVADLSESLPETAAELWLTRTESLSRSARRALAAASVLGTEFDVDILDRAVPVDSGSIEDAMREGMAAGLLAPAGAGRFRFEHSMLRDHFYESLPVVRRRRLHRLVARALEADAPDDGSAEPALAFHYLEAGDAFRHDALVHTIAAARWNFGQGAIDTSRDLADRSLEILEALEREADVDQARCAARRVELGDVLELLGVPEGRDVLLGCTDYFEAVGDVESLARVATILMRRGDASVFDELNPAVEFVERLLPRLDQADPRLQARVLTGLALSLDFRGRSDEQHAMTDRAVEIARQSGDPVTLAIALDGQRPSCAPDRINGWLTNAHELTALGERMHDPEFVLRGLLRKHLWEIGAGRVDVARKALTDAAAVAERVPDGELARIYSGNLRRNMEAWLSVGRVIEDLISGRFARAEEHLAEVNRWAAEPTEASGRLGGIAAAQLVQLFYDLGRTEELAAGIDAWINEWPDLQAWRAAGAMIAAEDRHLDVAAEYLRPIVETRLTGLESDAALVTALVALGRATFLLDDTDAAGLVIERLRPYAGRIAAGVFVCVGTVDWALGMCAGTLGHGDEAEAWFTSGLTLCREMHLPPFEARIELAWAEVCDRLGRPGGQVHAARAHELATDLGMARVAERASALLG